LNFVLCEDDRGVLPGRSRRRAVKGGVEDLLEREHVVVVDDAHGLDISVPTAHAPVRWLRARERGTGVAARRVLDARDV